MDKRMTGLKKRLGLHTKLLTVKELSEILNVKEKTLYQWAEFGQVPCLKINGSLRFDLNDIENWIRACKRDADSSYNPYNSNQRPRKGGKI